MIESTSDCGHLCCPERQMPFHDHFLSPDQCPTCGVHRTEMAAIQAAGADLRRKLAAAQPPGLPFDVCSQCKAETPDQVGLSLIETDELEAEDFGFCSVPCLVTFVQDRYLPRALAASPSPGRRSAVDGRGGDAGGTQGGRPRLQGSGRVVQAPPTSDGIEGARP